jgi:thiazolylpeptide-type bacteriocin precursor
MLNSTIQTSSVDDMFASFEMDELETLELTDSIALPEMGASWGGGWFCCSSSSSTCSAC